MTAGDRKCVCVCSCTFKIVLLQLYIFITCVHSLREPCARDGYVYACAVINILNHFNYKKGKIALVGQKQLREL